MPGLSYLYLPFLHAPRSRGRAARGRRPRSPSLSLLLPPSLSLSLSLSISLSLFFPLLLSLSLSHSLSLSPSLSLFALSLSHTHRGLEVEKGAVVGRAPVRCLRHYLARNLRQECPADVQRRIFIELMTSDRKLRASREGRIYGISQTKQYTMYNLLARNELQDRGVHRSTASAKHRCIATASANNLCIATASAKHRCIAVRKPSSYIETPLSSIMRNGVPQHGTRPTMVLNVAPDLSVSSNRLFQVPGVYWHPPESGDLWYASRQFYLQALIIHKLGFNQNYNKLTSFFQIKIVFL